MLGVVRQGGAQRGLPVRQRLPRGSINQVDGRGEARILGPLNHLGHALGGVRAVQGRQDARHRGLHTERDPREASVGQGAQILARDGIRVGLQGHLGALVDPDAGAQPLQDRDQLGRVQHRRRTTAEKYGARRPLRQPSLGHDTRGQ